VLRLRRSRQGLPTQNLIAVRRRRARIQGGHSIRRKHRPTCRLTGCRRFIRRSEDVCPFCAASVADAFTNAPECFELPRNLSRAAMIAMFGAAGCSQSYADYGAPPPPGFGEKGGFGAAGMPGVGGYGMVGAGGGAGTVTAWPRGPAAFSECVQGTTGRLCETYCSGVRLEQCAAACYVGSEHDSGTATVAWESWSQMSACEKGAPPEKIGKSCADSNDGGNVWFRCCCAKP
jgi:hypothetical protein